MASEKVELQFIADTSKAQAGIEQIDKSLDGIGKSAQEATGVFDRMTSFISSRFVITAGDIVNLGSSIASAIGGAVSALPGLISEGSGLDDLSGSFDALATKAGAVSDVFLNDLSKSLGDTIPKVDLMKQANELLLGGLKPDQIDLVAKAARTFGEVTGTNAVAGMNAFGDSLLRGNDKALKTLGIVLDNDKAIQTYADSLGKMKDELTETEKVEAIRNETLKLLAENTEKLGAVTEDSGDVIDQITTIITNQVNEAIKAIGTNEELKNALADLRDIIKEVDFAPIIQGLSDLISASVNAVTEIVKVGKAIADAFDTRSDAAKGLDQQIESIDKFEEALGSLSTAVGKAKSQEELTALKGKFEDLGKQLQGDKVLAQNYTTAFIGLNEGANRLFTTLPKATKESDKLGESLKKGSRGAIDHKKGSDDAAKAAQKLTDDFKKQTAELDDLVKKSDDYSNILSDIDKGLITAQQGGDKLKILYADKKAKLSELNIAQDVYNGLLLAMNKGLNVSATDLGAAAVKVEALKKEIEATSRATKEIKAEGGFFDGLLDGVFAGGGSAGGLEAVGQQLGQSLLNGLSSALNGDKLSKQETGAAIGEGIGAGIGAYFGDPQTGALLGNAAGRFLSTAFGSRNAQGAIRDALDRSFAEALENNPLQVNIDGSGVKITDLNFFKGTDVFSTGEFDDFFQTLDDTAKQSFEGLALGFSGVFGQGTELAGQLAAVLSTNLGGSLNNLQLLVQSTGKSFEELSEVVVEAFLDGELSALQAQSALQGIQKVAEKGIPDGIGLVKEAFDNIAAAGVKGGRTLVDALQDVGFEAKELGDKTLEQVMIRLKNTAGVSADEVDKVFSALNKAGIKTLDDLTQATAQELLPALADLENQKFPFAEAAKDAKEYLDAIDKIPEKKDVQLNLKINYPNAADQKVVQDLAGRGQLGQGVATR